MRVRKLKQAYILFRLLGFGIMFLSQSRLGQWHFLCKQIGYNRIFQCDQIFCGISTTANKKYAFDREQLSTGRKKSSYGKWLMLVFPIGGVLLGTWQVQRKQWKLGLISDLDEKTKSDPIPFPKDLSELAYLEYRPLTVCGVFDHSKETLIEPRYLVEKDGDKSVDSGSLMSVKNSKIGAQVITPFFIPDHRIAIMVNRGFVPREKRNSETRKAGQIEGVIELTGILRHNEKRPPLVPRNNPQKGQWNYKDLDQLGEMLGTSPILLDAVSTVPHGPIGGQTRVTLRDEHIQYAITWYSLAFVTAAMWYMRFIR